MPSYYVSPSVASVDLPRGAPLLTETLTEIVLAGGTPTIPALRGMHRAAADQRSTHPSQSRAGSCDRHPHTRMRAPGGLATLRREAAAGLANGVPTFVLAILGADEDRVASDLATVSEAGGTELALFSTAEAVGDALTCACFAKTSRPASTNCPVADFVRPVEVSLAIEKDRSTRNRSSSAAGPTCVTKRRQRLASPTVSRGASNPERTSRTASRGASRVASTEPSRRASSRDPSTKPASPASPTCTSKALFAPHAVSAQERVGRRRTQSRQALGFQSP